MSFLRCGNIMLPIALFTPTHSYQKLERVAGFEPATNNLEGCHSTPELYPHLLFTDGCCQVTGANLFNSKLEDATGIEPALDFRHRIKSPPPSPLGTRVHIILVLLPGLEPRSFPHLGIMPYKDTALPLSYRSSFLLIPTYL